MYRGNLTLEEEQVSNRFKYTGEQFDPVIQQYYLRARFYNPALARFMQEDTYRGDGLNLYAYCANNPVRYVDPSGYEKTTSWADEFEKHVAEETAFGKEHETFVYYDTPMANKVNEMIKQNQPQTPKADTLNDGRRVEGGSSYTLKINELPLAKPGEDLYVGTYSKSSYWNKKTGLNKTHTPHHAVQDAVSSVSHGKGITINIRKDIHLDTETYGSLRTGLTNRQHLAADVAELRVLLKEQGYSRSTINAQLNELIKQNKALGGFEK